MNYFKIIGIILITLLLFSNCTSQKPITKSYTDDIYYNPNDDIKIVYNPVYLYIDFEYRINRFHRTHYLGLNYWNTMYYAPYNQYSTRYDTYWYTPQYTYFNTNPQYTKRYPDIKRRSTGTTVNRRMSHKTQLTNTVPSRKPNVIHRGYRTTSQYNVTSKSTTHKSKPVQRSTTQYRRPVKSTTRSTTQYRRSSISNKRSSTPYKSPPPNRNNSRTKHRR